MQRTDDPVRDEMAFQQDKWKGIEHLPVCAVCDAIIYKGESALHLGRFAKLDDAWICKECVDYNMEEVDEE